MEYNPLKYFGHVGKKVIPIILTASLSSCIINYEFMDTYDRLCEREKKQATAIENEIKKLEKIESDKDTFKKTLERVLERIKQSEEGEKNGKN